MFLFQYFIELVPPRSNWPYRAEINVALTTLSNSNNLPRNREQTLLKYKIHYYALSL